MTMPKSGFFDGNGNTVKEGDTVIYFCRSSPRHGKTGILTLATTDGDAEVVFRGDKGTTPVKWNNLYLFYKTMMTQGLNSIEAEKEYETLQLNVGSYEFALYHIKREQLWRRLAWKPGKWIRLKAEECKMEELPRFEDIRRVHYMAHLVLEYDDGRVMPWTPTQCDQLENDWQEVGI